MDWQEITALAIVALTGAILLVRLVRRLKNPQAGCGCGCSSGAGSKNFSGIQNSQQGNTKSLNGILKT